MMAVLELLGLELLGRAPCRAVIAVAVVVAPPWPVAGRREVPPPRPFRRC